MNKLVQAAALDSDAAAKGVEVTYSPDGTNKFRTIIIPGGANNNKLAALLEEEFRVYRNSGTDPNDIDPQEQKAIAARCYTKAVVKTWNAEDFGEEFSEAACIRTMIAVPGYANFIAQQSGKENLFRAKQQQVSQGN